MPKDPATRREGGSASKGCGYRLLYCSVIALALSACAAPSLEDGSNLLAPPPDNQRVGARVRDDPANARQRQSQKQVGSKVKDDPALAQQNPGQTETPVLLGKATEYSMGTADSVQATSRSAARVQPPPTGSALRGQFSGNNVSFGNGDDVVCAGRLVADSSELLSGYTVPVNCSDGSEGKVKFISWASPDEAECVFYLGDSPPSPLRLVRTVNID